MNLQKSQSMYKFYATLLDSYQYFLRSESDTAMQEFLDKINRVPFESEAADTGTAFNELVDKVLAGKIIPGGGDMVPYRFVNKTGRNYNLMFKKDIILEFAGRLNGAIPQVHTEAVLHTSKGDVLLYGYIDEVLKYDITDIKTTGKYDFPKFLNAWQHRVYPYCLSKNGIQVETFTYRITDFYNYFEEVYQVNNEKAEMELISICENLIDFIELNKHLITDIKIFGNEF